MVSLSEHTQEILRKEKTTLVTKRKTKYNKILILDGSFDILENYGIIRKYLQWKYEISVEDLELLYYLYPKNYFSKRDFFTYPLRWGNGRFKKLEDDGFIENLYPKRKSWRVYRLSVKAQLIVKRAHQFLSGERKIPTDARTNKVFRETATYSQKKFRTVMETMRELNDKKFDYD